MPPRLRSATRAKRLQNLSESTQQSVYGENDLQICITNYYLRTKHMEQRNPTPPKQEAYWGDHAEQSMADIILDLKQRNKIHPKKIKTEVLPLIVRGLAELGLFYELEQVRSKYDWFYRLTRKYNHLRTEETGVGWDAATCKLTMSTEKWAAVVVESPNFNCFATGKHCALFYQLSEVWRDVSAKGQYAHSTSRVRTAALDNDSEVQDISDDEPSVSEPRTGQRAKGKAKGKKKATTARKRKTPENSDELESPPGFTKQSYVKACNWLHKSFSDDRSSEPSFGSPNPRPVEDPYSIQKAFQAIEELNLPKPVAYAACIALKESQREREALLSFTDLELRMMHALNLAGTPPPPPNL